MAGVGRPDLAVGSGGLLCEYIKPKARLSETELPRIMDTGSPVAEKNPSR